MLWDHIVQFLMSNKDINALKYFIGSYIANLQTLCHERSEANYIYIYIIKRGSNFVLYARISHQADINAEYKSVVTRSNWTRRDVDVSPYRRIALFYFLEKQRERYFTKVPFFFILIVMSRSTIWKRFFSFWSPAPHSFLVQILGGRFCV